MDKPIWIISEVPEAEWIVESVRHLPGAENNSRHHIFVDAVGPDGADLRGTGLHVVYGWRGMNANETPPPVAIDKPADEFGCHIPIFPGAIMYIMMDSPASEIVSDLHTAFEDEQPEEGNGFGHQSFHVVFRYAPPAQAALKPPPPEITDQEATAPAEPELDTPIPTPAASAIEAPITEPDGWIYRANGSIGGLPTYTKTFKNGLSALIVENVFYLASVRLPDGKRAGQQRYFHILNEAKQWTMEQAYEMVGVHL
jgi:hypothetical protein